MSALPHMTPILNYSQVHTYIGLPFQANASVSTERLHSCQILTESFYNSHHHARVFDLSNAAEWRPAFGRVWLWNDLRSHPTHRALHIFFFKDFTPLMPWCKVPVSKLMTKQNWTKKKGKKRTFSFGKSPSGQTTERNVMVMLKLRGSTLKNISL